MTFNNDGRETNKLNIRFWGYAKEDTLPFNWIATENQVTINSKNSDFGKTWIRIENNRKYQKWKSTDGTNQIQMLELENKF